MVLGEMDQVTSCKFVQEVVVLGKRGEDVVVGRERR